MSETMNLHQVPEIMTLHRALWAGRIMSAFVVIALVADGTIQLFAPAQIASMLQETGFAMDLTRVVGPIILACAILYAIPATAVVGAVLVTGFLGGAICAHVRIGELGSPPEIISLLLGVMTWGGLYARDPKAFDTAMKAAEKARAELESAELEWLELEEKKAALAG